MEKVSNILNSFSQTLIENSLSPKQSYRRSLLEFKLKKNPNWLFIIQFLSDCFIIFGPSINYVFQAIKFHKTKSSKGFSKLLCLVVLLSHSFRILFWFGKPFKYSLLLQSVLVNVVLLYLIHLCLKFNGKKNNLSNSNSRNVESISTSTSSSGLEIDKPMKKEKEENDSFLKVIKSCVNFLNLSKTLNPRYFWRWDEECEYYKFYFLLLATIAVIIRMVYFFYQNIIEFIGAGSVVLELISSIPQIYEICKDKQTNNISKLMVLMWFLGNIYKLMYNYLYKQPLQLIIGGLISVLLNLILVIQIIIYRNPDKRIKKERKIRYIEVNPNIKVFEKDYNNSTSTSANTSFEGKNLELTARKITFEEITITEANSNKDNSMQND